MPFGTSPDLIFHELWGRAARLAGAGEKHRCGDGAPQIGPATEQAVSKPASVRGVSFRHALIWLRINDLCMR